MNNTIQPVEIDNKIVNCMTRIELQYYYNLLNSYIDFMIARRNKINPESEYPQLIDNFIKQMNEKYNP